MPLVVSSTSSCAVAGRVFKAGAVTVDAPEAIAVYVNGKSITYLGVCTQLETNQSVVAQFQKTLSDNIYVVPFGDAPGDTSISFIANRTCLGSTTGGANVTAYYIANRLRPAAQSTNILSIGGMLLYGFLTSVRLNASAEGTPMVSGTLGFKSWPV